ncbi:MAG: hypothetical protein LBF58_03515 [Deltaproteobacteria bacterium]|nr:hypothetical protein [Deltaproteobacteria bacterium]
MAGNIERVVEELRLKIPFKPETNVGDVILIVRENDAGAVESVYARVMAFTSETKNRQEWWHADMAILSVPLGYVTFIASGDQLTGREIFTVGGRKIFITAVNTESCPARFPFPGREPAQEPAPKFSLTLVKPVSPKDEG